MNEQEIKKAVREGYALVAEQAGHRTIKSQEISKKIGYTEEELLTVPSGSNLGLGCGNPTALASIKEGETVLDLGSGAGFDCFLASNKVGPKGKVIGVDMTAEMVVLARENALKGGYKNVEFRQGEIEKLPVDANTIDLILSNGAINMVPDKGRAFKEAFRVLKPGGRLMVSDVVLLKELPEFAKKLVEAYAGYVPIVKDDYLDAIRSAGFHDVKVVGESFFPLEFVRNDPRWKTILESLSIFAEQLKKFEIFIASIRVKGIKPS